jgi:hypothetical protein
LAGGWILKVGDKVRVIGFWYHGEQGVVTSVRRFMGVIYCDYIVHVQLKPNCSPLMFFERELVVTDNSRVQWQKEGF